MKIAIIGPGAMGCFMAASLWLLVCNRSTIPWENYRTAILSGTALALAMLARPHIGVVGLMAVGVMYQQYQEHQIFT